MREGGSIPVAALFDQILQLPVVLMGFGLPDDGPHGPNEKFSLAQFARGMATVAEFLGRLRQ
jgi:acetylornithine deacetylase/succinyl-diaminopimelate desuccinylase-like protein